MLFFMQELVVLYAIALIGFMAKRIGWLHTHSDQTMTQLLLYITLPSLIMYSMDIPFQFSLVFELMWLILLSSFILLLSMYFTHKLKQHSCLGLDRQGVYAGTMMYGNQGFIGVAVVYLLFAEEGVMYATVFNIPYLLFIWTLGMTVVAQQEKSLNAKQLWLNPGILATVTGIGVFVLPVHWPTPISKLLFILGSCTVPLSMLLIGSLIANLSWEKLRMMSRDRTIWMAACYKLIVMPLLLVPFFFLPISPELVMIAVLISAMPSAPTISLYAQQFGRDAVYGSVIVGVTTLLAFITLPLIYGLTRLLM